MDVHPALVAEGRISLSQLRHPDLLCGPTSAGLHHRHPEHQQRPGRYQLSLLIAQTPDHRMLKSAAAAALFCFWEDRLLLNHRMFWTRGLLAQRDLGRADHKGER